MSSISRLVAAALVLLFAAQAHAVILYRTATRNTAAPTGTNYNSGWQWQGNWNNGFSGTPIASKYFITAEHVGGGVGQAIYHGGKNHVTDAAWSDPASDLKIFRIKDTFSTYAPIYTGTAETNKRAILIGRGTPRGSEVRVGTTLKGWKHKTMDWTRSWGENTVSGTLNGGTAYGQLLKFTFSKGGLTNEGGFSAGDSGGGTFINDAGKWKLAGVNYLVDGPFSFTSTGTSFHASLFDKGGLYQAGKFTPDTVADIPNNFYATRISSRASWINSIIKGTSTTSAAMSASSLSGTSSVPEPSSAAILLIGAGTLSRTAPLRLRIGG